MATVTVNGVELYCERYGEGTPVIFIHGGYGGPATSVIPPFSEPIVNVLAGEAAYLITYDRRCAGRSQYVLEPFTLEDIAADAAALLDHFDVERAVVVGSSAGGPIALQFALLWPERVIGLALPNTGPGLMCEPPAGYGEPYSAGVMRRLARVRSFLEQVEGARKMGDRAYFESRKEVLRNPPVPPGSAAPAPERARAREALAAIDDETLFRRYIGMLRNYAAYAERDFTARLGELTMPTFIVHGTDDLAVPIEYAETLKVGIGHAEYHVIQGAGHGIMRNPEAQRLLRDWIIKL
jgi:pimeloyl-ACP methyl ester carboxylesterase